MFYQICALLIVAVILLFVVCQNKNVNFDNNATTEPHDSVLSAMIAGAKLGNASSFYSDEAKKVLKDLRCAVLDSLLLPKEKYRCIITSGASESNNLILRGFKGRVLVSAIEHKTSIDCAESIKAVILPGDPSRSDWMLPVIETPSLLSVMAVNNETGNINDLVAISKKAPGALIHCDIVQFYGKFDAANNFHRAIIESCDAFSISFHKIHGPQGLGALIVPRDLPLQAQICGTQNHGLRGGTENIAACAGALAAIKETLKNRAAKNEHLKRCVNRLREIIAKYCDILDFEAYRKRSDSQSLKEILNSPQKHSKFAAIFLTKNSFNTVLCSFILRDPLKRFCNLKFRKALLDHGIKVSIGSACSTKLKGASHVLHEIGAPFIIRAGAIRFSFSDKNSLSELDYFERCFKKIMQA